MKINVEEVLYMYLAILQEAVSSVLIREDEKGIQRLIYYTS